MIESVIDNLMLGRHHLMRTGFFSGAVWWGRAKREEVEHRAKVEEVIEMLELEPHRHTHAGGEELEQDQQQPERDLHEVKEFVATLAGASLGDVGRDRRRGANGLRAKAGDESAGARR